MPRIVVFTDLFTYGVATWNETLLHLIDIPIYITNDIKQLVDYKPSLVIFSNATILSNIKEQQSVNKLGIPYIVVTHLITDTDLGSAVGVYKALIGENLEHAKKIIAVSKSIAKKLQAFTEKKIEVIYPSPPYYFYKGKTSYKKFFDIKGKLFLTVARLCGIKGYYELLSAIDQMRTKNRSKFNDATFAFVGTGPEELKITEKIFDLKLDDKIILAGQQSPENTACWFDAADVFVLPSKAEGLPIALIEATMRKIPVIITPVDGVKEVFGSITTKPENLCEALCNPPNNGEKAFEIYENNLTMQHTFERLKSCVLTAF